MRFPFYIAKRYLFSKKSHNAINVISGVSVCGVALATLALVCTLSVFNGFQDLVTTMFTAFDPELKITSVSGKVFDAQDARIQSLCEMPEVELVSEALEDNAMVQYKDRQAMVVIKGVEDNFHQLTAIDSILYGRGEFLLHDEVVSYAIPGIELVSVLGTGIRFLDPLEVYAPKRGTKINVANPSSSFNSDYLHSSGLVFAVNQQKYDASYILTSLDFARELFQYQTEVTSIELKLKEGSNIYKVQDKIAQHLGKDFQVLNRYEQQAETYRMANQELLSPVPHLWRSVDKRDERQEESDNRKYCRYQKSYGKEILRISPQPLPKTLPYRRFRRIGLLHSDRRRFLRVQNLWPFILPGHLAGGEDHCLKDIRNSILLESKVSCLGDYTPYL